MRRFCGWEAASWTEYQHDEDGRLLRSQTRTEPEWDDGQRLWMLALALYESTLCKRCGHDLHHTTGDTWAFVPNDPVECKSCTALARSERAYAKSIEGSDTAVPAEAIIHTVRRVRDYTPSELQAMWAAEAG